MRRHTITAAILMVLAPLTAAVPGAARAAGQPASVVETDEVLPSVADEMQGLQPVYTPGNVAGQYGPGPYAPGPGPYGSAGGCGDCGCGDCGCDSCEPPPCCEPCCRPCRCGPRLEGRAAGIVLKRNNPNDVPFVSDGAGTAIFEMSQFSFDYEPGVDGSVAAYINPCVSVQARYLALFDVNDEVVAGPFTVDGAPLPVFFNTTPPSAGQFPVGNTLITAEYESELQSGEISLRGRAAPWLTGLGGFRYINLRERFHANFNFTDAAGAPLGTADFNDRVENHLYGIQLGAEVDFFQAQRKRINVHGFAKAGMYLVQADREVSFVTGVVNNTGSGSESQAAFVGEAGLSVSFQVTRYMAVNAGYQVLYLEGVAVASDQITATGNLTPPVGNVIATRVDVDGNVFYHGATAGVDFRF